MNYQQTTYSKSAQQLHSAEHTSMYFCQSVEAKFTGDSWFLSGSPLLTDILTSFLWICFCHESLHTTELTLPSMPLEWPLFTLVVNLYLCVPSSGSKNVTMLRQIYPRPTIRSACLCVCTQVCLCACAHKHVVNVHVEAWVDAKSLPCLLPTVFMGK